MKHILSIEPVVAKLVVKDFVCREIVSPGGVRGKGAVKGEQEGRLAQSVAVSPVLEVPHGTYGEDELLVRIPLYHQVQEQLGLLHRKPVTAEFSGRTLQAIGDGLSVFVESVTPSSSESYNHFITALIEVGSLLQGRVGIFQKRGFVRTCEGGVVREGADESGAGSHRDAVGWAEGYAGGEPLQ